MTHRFHHGCPRCAARGFSLVELVAVVTVLVMLTVALSGLFSSSEASALRGLGQTRNLAAAQAALTMFGRDVTAAVADEHLTFLLEEGTACYGTTNSRLAFISMQTPESASARDAHLTIYTVRPTSRTWGTRYDLVRSSVPIPATAGTGDVLNAYWSDAWTTLPGAEEATLVRNVALFRAVTPEGGTYVREYDSREPQNADRPPRSVDVYLEVLDENDLRRVADMQNLGTGTTNVQAFVEFSVRRFTARAHPLQREGYRER